MMTILKTIFFWAIKPLIYVYNNFFRLRRAPVDDEESKIEGSGPSDNDEESKIEGSGPSDNDVSAVKVEPVNVDNSRALVLWRPSPFDVAQSKVVVSQVTVDNIETRRNDAINNKVAGKVSQPAGIKGNDLVAPLKVVDGANASVDKINSSLAAVPNSAKTFRDETLAAAEMATHALAALLSKPLSFERAESTPALSSAPSSSPAPTEVGTPQTVFCHDHSCTGTSLDDDQTAVVDKNNDDAVQSEEEQSSEAATNVGGNSDDTIRDCNGEPWAISDADRAVAIHVQAIWSDIPAEIDNLLLLKPLGQGLHAEVWLCLWGNRVVALKCGRASAGLNGGLESWQMEAEVLLSVQHRNVPKLVYQGRTQERTFLLMEAARYGDVRTFASQRQLCLRDVLGIGIGAASALEQLHGEGIVHRDVKPENLLLTSHFGHKTILLADYGLSEVMSGGENARSTAGTMGFTAPEISARGPNSSSADVWGLGMSLFALWQGFGIADVVDFVAREQAIAEGRGYNSRSLNRAVEIVCRRGVVDKLFSRAEGLHESGTALRTASLLARMLSVDPSQRPDLRAVGVELAELYIASSQDAPWGFLEGPEIEY